MSAKAALYNCRDKDVSDAGGIQYCTFADVCRGSNQCLNIYGIEKVIWSFIFEDILIFWLPNPLV